MKKISLFFLFSTIGIFSNAQEVKQEREAVENQPQVVAPTSKEITKSANGTSTTISIRAGESQVTHNNAYYQNKIAQIDAQILAINNKIAIVNADAQEKLLATDSGWFTDMEKIKAELENQKVEIQSHLN